MHASPSATSSRPVWVELDVMRGLAAVLMILNHAGFAWLSARDATESAAGFVVFAGSFAPVLFFFVTGAGAGFSDAKRGRSADFKLLLPKLAMLVVADQFFAWTRGRPGASTSSVSSPSRRSWSTWQRGHLAPSCVACSSPSACCSRDTASGRC